MAPRNARSRDDYIYKQVCFCIENNDLDQLETLIKEVKSKDKFFNVMKQSLIHFTVLTKQKDDKILQLLIHKGFDVNAIDLKYQTPLFLAIVGVTSFFQDLLIINILHLNPDHLNVLNFNLRPLAKEKLEIIECLLKHGAKMSNKRGRLHQSAIHLAVGRHDCNLIKLLLQHGFDVNESIDNWGTPLTLASCLGNVSVVEYLLENHADPFLVTRIKNNDILPIFVAVIGKHNNIINLLVKYMAKENKKDILHRLIEGSPFLEETDIAVFENIIRKLTTTEKIDINFKNDSGYTPLHVAVISEHDYLLEALLRCGADVDSKDNLGNSALHLAFQKRLNFGFKILLDHIPNLDVLNKNGEKPYDKKEVDDKSSIAVSIDHHENIMHILHNEDNYFCNEGCCMEPLDALSEINSMKDLKLPGFIFDYSLHDFTTLPVHKLINCVRNESIIEFFQDISFQRFPIYGNILQQRFNKIKIRNNLFYSSTNAFNTLVQCNFPDFITIEIFHYLSNDDIRNIVRTQEQMLEE